MKKFMLRTALCASCMILCSHFVAAQLQLNPKLQPQFVNPLPIPPIIDGRDGGRFTIEVTQFNQWLGIIDPITGQHLSTKVWGYNGSYPGPTILAKKNIPISIFWRNNLLNKK